MPQQPLSDSDKAMIKEAVVQAAIHQPLVHPEDMAFKLCVAFSQIEQYNQAPQVGSMNSKETS